MDRPVGKGVSLDFSPTYRGAQPQGKDGACVTLASEDANKENERSSGPVLSLVQFSRAPFVSFEAVKLGTSRAAVLVIDNPNDHVTEIRVDKIPAEKGFSVDQMHFSLNPDESTCLTVRWTPVEEGGVRELLTFIANGIVKHQAILLGRAESHKKKKRSLWESIKTKKPAGRPVTVKGRKTESTLNKTVNRTFHVSRKVQYLKEKARSPLQSLNAKPVLGNRTPVKANPMDFFAPEQNNAPGSLPRSKTYSVLNKSSSDDSFQACEPVLSPAVLDGVSDSPFQETVSVSFCNVTKVVRELNRTHSPVNTPDRVINPLTPQIHSRHVSGSFVSSSVGYESCTSSVTSVLSIQDALEIIQSDVAYPSESRAVSPAASSSFDGTDSLDSLKDDDDEDAGSLRIPTVALPEFSSDLEPAKSRLTFFVSSKPVPETNVQVPAESKPAFTSATVTKSKSCPVQEGTSRPAKKGASRRRLLGKTMGLSEGDSDKARFGRMTAVALCGLPVIDSDVSLEASLGSDWIQSPRVPRHMVASPKLTFPDISPLSLSPSGTPVLATQPDLSPIVAVQPTGSSLSTWNDLMLVTSQLDLCPVSSEQPDKSPLVEPPPLPVVFAPTELRNKKRKSGEFLKENSVQVGQTLHVKRSRTSRMSAGVVQDKRPISRAAAQKPRQKTAASLISTSSVTKTSTKSVGVAQSQLTFSKSSKGTQSSKSMVTTSLKKKKAVVGVAMSRLTFIKPIQSAIPRHPLPFAAKNMFYDERWIEKQERGFTWWINYVLTPDDFKVNTEVSKVSAVSLVMGADNPHKASVPKAPTKEEMSFRAYTARCRLNRLRRAACGLFTSEAMVKAIQRLELEIEARRLLVRKDRHLWKDIGERQKILNWLLSYNPLWLRIGLETIYGELISLESNSDVTGLAMFILSRLLWNPDIAAEYRHPKVPNLYRDGHEEALSRFTLKKLLLLVCFLDKAKESRMIDHDPCLFCMDAEFKTSKDLLLAFSRDFLSGEGILSRHLGYLGLAVSHAQTPLDEFNFAVKNLAVDLRCGIRLVRVMELFVQDWSLSRKLRVPAISRLQKIHNVEVALQVLKARGIDLKDDHGAAIDARDVVDGHREKTLALLWKIIFAFQVDILLDEKQLEEEINFLKRTWRTRQELASLRSNHGVVEKTGEGGNNDLKSGKKVDLLMEWVNAVCRFYSTKIENFTVSFSDGQVLCYLIHHYHPSYLPLDAISQHTTQTVECGQRGAVGLNCSTSDSDSSFEAWPGVQNAGFATSVQFKKLLDNERKNFHLVDAAVSDLGGVPAMLNPTDMSNTIPNEKVVMCYLSFLCARLLDLRKETRAARVIQGAWRKYRLKLERKLYEERNQAASKIQSVVVKFLQHRREARRNAAALLIQTAWRGHVARQRLRSMKNKKLQMLWDSAATTIQVHWRRYCAVKNFQRLKRYTVVLQACVRMKIAVAAYKKVLWAVTTIQRCQKARQMGKEGHQKYLTLRHSAIVIQRGFRRWKAQALIKANEAATVIQAAFRKWEQRKMARRNQAALRIQAWYRMHKCQRQYFVIRGKVIKIQAWYRGHVDKCTFQARKHAAITIQRFYRSYKQCQADKDGYALVCRMATVIQSYYRGMKAREYVRQMKAARFIQSLWRMKRARLRFLHTKGCVIVLQACVRKWHAQTQYRKMRASAAVIQTHYRAYVMGRNACSEYSRVRCAVICLQSAYRGWQARKMAHLLRSVIKIQAYFRAYAAHKRFGTIKAATVKIQSCVKMVQARQRYHRLKKATLQIQRSYRAAKLGNLQRTEYQKKRRACICLQAAVRGYVQRRSLQMQKKAAVKIQSSFRAYKERMCYLKKCKAAVVIQKYYRTYKESVLCRRRFLKLKAAAVCLQASYQGYRFRRSIKCQHESAIVIQTAFRAHVQRQKFAKMRQSSILIQRWFRACKVSHQDREGYVKMRSAAIVLQAAYRGYMVRKEMLKRHRATTLIQAAYRMFVNRRRFFSLKRAAVAVQRQFKAKREGEQQRQKYKRLCSLVVKLQALWRGYTLRKQVGKWHQAAVVIQSFYRMHQAQSTFVSKKRAALVVQNRYRAYCSGKKQLSRYLEIRRAALTLQAGFRGMKVRTALKEQHEAATVIQAAFKTFICKKKWALMKTAAVLIQRRYRARLIGQRQQQEFAKLRQAAIKLQATYRGFKVRRDLRSMHKAATVIQAKFRMHKAKIAYCAMRVAAIIIQQHYRAYVMGVQEHKRYLLIKSSAVVIQSAYSGMKVRVQLQKMHRAATVIQAHYRKQKQLARFRRLCWAARVVQQRYRAAKRRDAEVQNYRAIKNAAICLQSAIRGIQARRNLKKMQSAARIIQRRYAAYTQRMRYLSTKAAAVTVQRWYRALIVARQQQKQYHSMRSAAITLQAGYRGMIVRREMQRKIRAATVIQASFRKYRTRVPFKALRLAAIIIQRRYRCYFVGKREREQFVKLRRSVTLIQATFRGQKLRADIARMHSAATVIQAQFRMHRQRIAFRKLLWAAAVVQKRYRACRVRDVDVQQYRSMKMAAVVIQSTFRGFKARQQIKKMHTAASVIQWKFKAFRENRRFLSIQAATVLVQQKYRALIAARTQRKIYLLQRSAAITIQSAYRGMKARSAIGKQHQAATVIQAAFRMHRCRIPFKAMKLAATLLQRRYRAYVRGRNERLAFSKLHRSALLIQAAYRGREVRRELQAKHNAAAVIQAQVRMQLRKSHYKRLQWAAKVVQQQYRANKMRDVDMKSFNLKKHAAIVIQSASRGMKSRRHLRNMHKAAIVIQSTFKAYSTRNKYLALKASVSAIQLRYRALIVAKRQKEHDLSLRRAAVTIQAAFRGNRVRKEIGQKHVAATVIQAAFRSHREMVKFQAMKLSALIIQMHYKAYLQVKTEREKYLRLRRSALTIQAAFRGQSVRQTLLRSHKAAVVIQSSYRMHRQRMVFKKLCGATKVLQQRFRAKRLRDFEEQWYRSLKKAVVCLQAAFRAKRARRLATQIRAARKIQSFLKMRVKQRHFLQQKAASIVIQTAFRSYRARIGYAAMQESAIVIQRWFRFCKVAREQKAQFTAIKQATVTLQCAFRGMMARKMARRKRAAVKVQSVLRMVVCRRRFLMLRSATVVLQAHYRIFATKRQFRSYVTAARTLQKHYRAYQARRQQRAIYLETLKCIRKLQARIRGFNELRRFQTIKKSAVTIQAFYRGVVQRRKFLQWKASATTIQTHFRAHLLRQKERAKYLEMKKSAVTLQTMMRGYLSRRLLKRIRVALKIQAWYRGAIMRRDFRARQRAIATVGHYVRARLIRKRFLLIRQAVHILQTRWRETLHARKERNKFLQMKSSCVKIQALWRGYSLRETLQREKRERDAAITIQACCRGWLVRKRMEEETRSKRRLRFSAAVYHHLCAVRIQRVFRAHLALKSAKQQIHCVISIQRWIRSKLQRKSYLEERRKIVTAQRAVHSWLSRRNKAATVIQHAVKKFLREKRLKRIHRGIVRMQALWRGHRSRLKSDTTQLVAMRRRFVKVNQEAKEEDKLCNKTTTAIDYLLRYRHFSYILAALKQLETATRLSPQCCEHLVKSGATLTIFILIRSCNRSVPCMEVITYAIQVLLNLSKYDKTTEAVYDVENSIDTLLELMQIYREKAGDKVADKGGSIFTKTCFLLVILLQDHQRALEVRKLPKVAERVCSIYRLTARKHKMDAERTVTRQKMNVSLNGSFFSQATPRKARALPRIVPDWVLRKDSMKEVVDPLRAIQMVAEALAVVL
ncbi:abnormal spindle-like microcephaly-associated protein [Amia ocellicauda]|uniref:abnormal spindle-like microcephaly-associated protein n=1 Tax=Amia ocellicauda TaxID=2972642 RepID=UPI003464A324